MGLLILVIAGVLLGWLGSIIFQRRHRLGIISCLSAGLAGALVGGIAADTVPLRVGISPQQLLWATVAAVVAILLAHLVGCSIRHGAYR